LGLATVKNAVDGLKGDIKITDNKGGGTVFTCNIPVEVIENTRSNDEQYDVTNLVDDEDLREVNEASASAKTKEEIKQTESQKPQPSKPDKITSDKRLLLIEDNIAAGKGALMLLKKAGFSIDWVETGEKGLSEILNGDYEIIISDIGLPDINGDKVVLRARQEGVDIPIYALTGHANADKEALLENGFTEVMVKPLNIKSFLNLIQNYDYHAKELEAAHEKPVIDLSLSNEIGFDLEAVKEILNSFIISLDSDKQELQQGIAERNIKKLRDILHRTRGGAAYACVPKLSAVLKTVHENLKEHAMDGEVIDFDELFEPLFNAIEELKIEFRKSNY